MSNFARRIFMAMAMSRIDAGPSRLIYASCVRSICGSFLYVLLIFTSAKPRLLAPA